MLKDYRLKSCGTRVGMVPVTRQARPPCANFAVDAIAKKNMEKAVVYRCQHANWRTRQQKSMTSGDTR